MSLLSFLLQCFIICENWYLNSDKIWVQSKIFLLNIYQKEAKGNTLSPMQRGWNLCNYPVRFELLFPIKVPIQKT